MVRARRNFKHTNARSRTRPNTREHIPEAKYRYLLSLLETLIHELDTVELGLMISFLQRQKTDK
ncbi:uncharacterized protein APUU_80762A [Aspergillus puulaauensis]|uniref:Uncharacterized protein n=1 Tax=Aspergillus puulaauensis TaxID=1220207 RepID=A0A7R8ASJ5_9EURO|nr:uncharacterized protein APUU_80762A [Aspergillus puulaauensis]BCS30459.1 hypothetical protein APUU_80762A [Aspergillus puulaauensis]